MAMTRYAAPFLRPEDLTADPPPETGLPCFQDYLLRQFSRLGVSQRAAPRLLRELLGLFAEKGRASEQGILWARPSQRALGALVEHKWGDRRRGLHRCTVNRILARMKALKVVRMRYRGQVGDRTDPHGWRLANLVYPGAWVHAIWAVWCGEVATRLGRWRGRLAETFRRILAWAARRLFDVRSSAQDWEGLKGRIPGSPGEGGPTGPPLPRASPPPAPPPAIEEVLAEIERIRRDRDW